MQSQHPPLLMAWVGRDDTVDEGVLVEGDHGAGRAAAALAGSAGTRERSSATSRCMANPRAPDQEAGSSAPDPGKCRGAGVACVGMAKGGIVANLVVHFEIHASEPQRLIDFYAALFGWNFTQFGDMPYWAIDTGDGAIGMDTPGRDINGGLMQRKGPAPERGASVNGCDFVVGVDGSSSDRLLHDGCRGE